MQKAEKGLTDLDKIFIKRERQGVLIHDLVWEVGGHFVIITSLQGKQSTATVFHRILAKPFKIRHLLISSLCSNL